MRIEILQIGAGGTGSWFARTFAQILCQYCDKHRNLINLGAWEILDYDKVERRNLLRQPFIGGVGSYKSQYLAECLKPLLGINRVNPAYVKGDITMLKGPDLMKKITTFPHQSALAIVVSCVDNTYTRQCLEMALTKCARKSTWYVNMGVSAEGDWFAEAVNAPSLLRTVYDTVTYPDGMMSCAQRAEHTPVPQTTYSNMMAGAMAAHMCSKIIAEELSGPTERHDYFGCSGIDFTCREISKDEYVQAHLSDLAKSMEEKHDDTDSHEGLEGETLNDL